MPKPQERPAGPARFRAPVFPSRPTTSGAAAAVIHSSVIVTECDQSRTLSEICGCPLWLKFENLQFTSTFKERGALHRLLALSPDERRRGVIAMSAGNHAQGVAYHAHRLGIPATIVMPVGTPMVKIENTGRHGAEIIISGKTLEEAAEFARAHGKAQNLTMIHPTTIRMSSRGRAPSRSKCSSRAAARYAGGSDRRWRADFRHGDRRQVAEAELRIVGVQAQLYPSMYNAIKGERCRCAATRSPKASPSRRRAGSPPRSSAVSSTTLFSSRRTRSSAAVAMLIAIEKTVVEGAGAAGLAAVLAAPERFAGRNVGLVLTGGNIDTRLIASVLTRELAREGRLTQIAIDIVDRPDQLAAVSALLAEAGANIIEVSHQRTFSDLPAKGTLLEVVIETRRSRASGRGDETARRSRPDRLAAGTAVA